MTRRRLAILTAALAALGAGGAAAPTRAQVPDTPRDTLVSPQSAAADRQLAASRLAARAGDADALDALTLALSPASLPEVQSAAADAIGGARDPDPRLAGPLLALIEADAPPAVLISAGAALGRFAGDGRVVERLATLATTADTPEPRRRAAVAGLARATSQSAAEALVAVLDGEASEALERDAGAALARMTGLPLADDDPAGWRAWWQRSRDLSAVEFEASLLRTRADAVERARVRADEAAAAVYELAARQYRTLGRAEQVDMLLQHMRSPLAELRLAGARLALDDASFAELSPRVAGALPAAVADPDARVRATVARVLQRRPDAGAADALLDQVAREPAAEARLEQVDALASLARPAGGAAVDARVLAALLALSDDPSASVRRRATAATATLASAAGGPEVRRVSARLRERYESADAATRAGRRERRDVLSALSSLNDPDLMGFYVAVLTRPPRPGAPTRAAALRGLATIGGDRVGDVVVGFLSDEDPSVREQAVRATAATSLGFGRAETLLYLTRHDREADATVRAAAWESILTLFPKAGVQQLAAWPTLLKDQPERRLTVLRLLADKSEAAGDGDAAASWRQEAGQVLLEDLNRPAEAASAYRAALDYSLSRPSVAATVKTRTESVLRSLLRAQDFAAATRFASETIGRDAGAVEDVGRIMKLEAERFARAGQSSAARRLIESALSMSPPLDGRTVGQLRDYLRQLPAGG